MVQPYRDSGFVDLAELIRANRFDRVGAMGDFEIDPAMLEIDPPQFRDAPLETVGHPVRGHIGFSEVAERLRDLGRRPASVHGLLRWALTADIRLKSEERFFVASVSRLYLVERIKDIPHWNTYYVPVIFYRGRAMRRPSKDFFLCRSHARDGRFSSRPGLGYRYLVHARTSDSDAAP